DKEDVSGPSCVNALAPVITRTFYNLPKLTDKVFLGHSPLLSSLPDGVALPGYSWTTKEELVISRVGPRKFRLYKDPQETISRHQQSEKTLIYLRREGLYATLRKVTAEPSCSFSDPNAVSTFSHISVNPLLGSSKGFTLQTATTEVDARDVSRVRSVNRK
ncbi:hypothetical protein J6590_086997, partial [Homalodisca vitripennis]